MVSVTASPLMASPPTVPVMFTLPAASAALIAVSAVITLSEIVGAGAVVSMVYDAVLVPVPVLPAASVVLMLASTECSLSVRSSDAGSMMGYAPLLTVAVFVWPLTVSVTVSPFAASPPTVPVTLMLPAASEALITLSAVIASTLMVGAGVTVAVILLAPSERVLAVKST